MSGNNADVIIFANKGQANSISGSSGNPNPDAIPTYRAFDNNAGTVRRYAPSSGIDANYQSPSDPLLQQLPSLDEAAWEAAGGGTPAAVTGGYGTTVWNPTAFTDGTIAD
jgi:hypothetical protein